MQLTRCRIASLRAKAFTLVELLVVIAVLAILASILLSAFSRARESGRATSCASNLKQIGLALFQYSEDNNGPFPTAGAEISWDELDPATGRGPWTQQIQPYVKNTQIFRCPSDSSSDYSYFLAGRAAYLEMGAFAPIDARRIQFPTAFVLSGDTTSGTGAFGSLDADKDDYSQNCVGGAVNGTPFVPGDRHNSAQNLLFADGHVKRFTAYNPELMTFDYTTMKGWP